MYSPNLVNFIFIARIYNTYTEDISNRSVKNNRIFWRIVDIVINSVILYILL